MNTILPVPSDQALASSESLIELVRASIDANNGWIDFATYMHQALYAPGVGYYSGGAKKFGHGGDFVTAPEISSLFAQTLTRQAAQILQRTSAGILELGAGTGRLAAEMLLELARLESVPEQYLILEVSAYLRETQKQTLESCLPTELLERVRWLEELPEQFSGLVLGNEVLDALPVHIIRTTDNEVLEMGVAWNEEGFFWAARPLADPHLQSLIPFLDLPPGYLTELCPAANGLIASLSNMLDKGVMLLIDYGFSRREYYHPQRAQGTLMCHYQHYAHDDPFLHPGLQDITAHVDFTGIAQTALANGMELEGYCGQAQFLINCGITEILARTSPDDMAAYIPRASAAQKLLSPAEMGELFKVIAFGKQCECSLIGFSQGDRSHTL